MKPVRGQPRFGAWRGRWGAVLAAALLLGRGVIAQPAGLEAAALAPPVPRPGATLFTELAPESTALHAPNAYSDPAMWAQHFERFAYGSMGSGVAIADYDGDGRPDVFVACKTEPDHLFRNLGDWRFEDVTEKAGVAGDGRGWKSGAAFADVNNDGRLDLYVCRVGAPNLLYLNRGDGTFVEAARECGLDLQDASVMGAFCDYDRDGWLDVYVVTNLLDFEQHPGGQRDYLFRNRGDGTFENVTAKAGLFGEGQRHAALWCDVDTDGWPDVYVTYDYGWPDQLFRNNRDGTFTNVLGAVLPHVPRFSMGADFGDVNNDGLIDLIIPDMLPTTRERDQRSMIDARAHIAELPDPAMTPQVMRNALFLNTGTGRFLEAGFLAGVAATDWTWGPRLEDLDNDGRLDLFVTNGTIREFFDGDIRHRIENLPPAERKRIFRASPVLKERNLAFRNAGDVQFENVSAAWGLDHLGVSFGAAFGDLDGDGDLDLVFTNFDENVVACRNDSARGHRLIVALRGTRSNRFGVGATVRVETSAGVQVRQLTLARGYLSTSEPVAHFGLGEADHVRRLAVSWPSGAEQEFTALAADHRYTITEPTDAPTAAPAKPSVETPAQFVEIGHALGLDLTQPAPLLDELAAQPLLPFRQHSVGPTPAVGDLNGDRLDDLVLSGTAVAPAQIRIAQPDGSFTPLRIAEVEERSDAADAAPLVFDADGDGRNDLLLAKGGVSHPSGDEAYRPQLLLNRGNGRFEMEATWLPDSVRPSAGPVVAADFNRDGRLDVFIGGRVTPGAYPRAARSVLLLNRGDSFADATDELAPGLASAGLVSGALWSDVDADGWLDLLIALQWGPVRCWRNVGGERFEDASVALGFAAAGSGWWNSIAAADFNGDGAMDYAVGNLGLNTRYQASPAQPVMLLRGAVDRTETPQILEAEYHEGRLVPVRGRSTMMRVMPWVGTKLPTFRRYADATLEEIFGEERIAAAERYAVTELRSGVFLSQRGQPYRFEPLPRIAQIAPIFGIAAGDFDADGRADLYAVQNSYAPIPEIGRFAGGLSQLLRGDGRGGFVPATPRETQLIVPGEARGLAVIDLDQDGWPEFLVTRTNQPMLVFGNTGLRDRAMLGVRLRGRPGNPTAIGARVEAQFANAPMQVAEVAAGAGYGSQSTATVFFGYPTSRPPQTLRIHWPGGRSTEVAPPARAGTIVVSAPAD